MSARIAFPRQGAAGVPLLLLTLSAGFFAGRWSTSEAPEHSTDSATAHAVRPPAQAATSVQPVEPLSESPRPASTWQARWGAAAALGPGLRREQALAELLRERARQEPLAALECARGERNARLRLKLLSAAVSGWATVDPAAAFSWTRHNLFDTDRRTAVEAMIGAGTAQSAGLQQAVRALCAEDATYADDYGRMLLATLAGEGAFASALEFARATETSHRDYWLSATMYSWAQYEPQAAAATLATFTDPSAYNEAAHGLILGWSSNDPLSLLTFAERLPAGNLRSEAYNQALQNWVVQDPVAASAWLESHAGSPEFDSGAQKLAISPALVATDVQTALGWARSVSDPEQRSIALVDVVLQWAQQDPDAARRYAQSSTELQPQYRTQLVRELGLATTEGSTP